LAILAPSLKPALSLSILRSLLRFGVPLVPAGLAGLVMVSADRYFLQHYSTTTEVGLYSLGYTIGLVVSLIVTSVQLAWPAQMFTIAKQSDAERQFSTILTYYAVVLGFIGLSVSVLAHEVLMAMATPNFYGAAAVVPVIVVSYIFHGFRYMTNTGLSTKNKMKYVPPMIIGAALLNLGLNFILIPTYGMMGAAWATLISYIVLAVVSMVVNLHFWSIPYEYGRMVKVALAWGTVYGLSKLLPFTDVWASSGSKLLLLATYPVFLYLFRFFQRHELERLKALLKRMVGRV